MGRVRQFDAHGKVGYLVGNEFFSDVQKATERARRDSLLEWASKHGVGCGGEWTQWMIVDAMIEDFRGLLDALNVEVEA